MPEYNNLQSLFGRFTTKPDFKDWFWFIRIKKRVGGGYCGSICYVLPIGNGKAEDKFKLYPNLANVSLGNEQLKYWLHEGNSIQGVPDLKGDVYDSCLYVNRQTDPVHYMYRNLIMPGNKYYVEFWNKCFEVLKAEIAAFDYAITNFKVSSPIAEDLIIRNFCCKLDLFQAAS